MSSTKKRDPAATREQILAAARQVFARSGYARSSTRELAAAADVTEKTLFRYFPSKGELFTAAVVLPLKNFIDAWMEQWRARTPGLEDPVAEMQSLIGGLYDVLGENRNLIVAVIAANTFDADRDRHFADLRAALSDLLTHLEQVMDAEAAQRGWTVDSNIVIRLLIGMVIAVTAHRDLLFSTDAEPDRKRLVDAIAVTAIHGLAGPGALRSAPRPTRR